MSGSPDTIIHLEVEPRSLIRVIRNEIRGFSLLRRPKVDFVEDQMFSTFAAALDLAKREPGFNHAFEIPIGQSISAGLEGPRLTDDELLVVETSGERGVSPRMIKDHHGVSTDYQTYMDVVVERCGPKTVFDRGVAWVGATNSYEPLARPRLRFNLLSGESSHHGLWVAHIEGLADRVDRVLHDLVRGMSHK